jgi:glycosyltransferase involved in cell wall biosynthesis
MKKYPLISVVIPNYNYARFISEAISSVMSQTYKNIEIIVVNNGSTDESLSILRTFGSKIRLIDQQNLGQSGARNSGLKAAKGDLIAFLDADDYWQKDKLEKQIKLITPQTELVYSGISRFRDNSRQIESIQLPQFNGNCCEIFTNFPGVSVVLSGESTSLFTRNLLSRVGNFDSNLNSASGWDFFRRCSVFTNFDFVPEPLTNYRLHSSNMSLSNTSNIKDIRNAYGKMFSDDSWNISADHVAQIVKKLEISFFKTYVRDRNFFLAIETISLLLRKSRDLYPAYKH